MPASPDRIASPQFLLLWSSSFTFYLSFCGLGLGAAQPVTMAWAADLVPTDERGKAMGTFYAAFELGIATGATGFGAVLARSNFPVMFLTAAAVALTGATLAVCRWKPRPN